MMESIEVFRSAAQSLTIVSDGWSYNLSSKSQYSWTIGSGLETQWSFEVILTTNAPRAPNGTYDRER
jgi:hypothetical protein